MVLYNGYPVLTRGLAQCNFFAEKPNNELNKNCAISINEITISGNDWLNTTPVPIETGIKLMRNFFHDKVWNCWPKDMKFTEEEAFKYYVIVVLPKQLGKKWSGKWWNFLLEKDQ